MYERLRLLFKEEEYSALFDLAEEELRGPAEQAQYIVRQFLRRRGLLACPPQEEDKVEVEAGQR